jgi:transposase-like protein
MKEFRLKAVQRLEQGVSVVGGGTGVEMNANVLYRWREEFREGQGNAF